MNLYKDKNSVQSGNIQNYFSNPNSSSQFNNLIFKTMKEQNKYQEKKEKINFSDESKKYALNEMSNKFKSLKNNTLNMKPSRIKPFSRENNSIPMFKNKKRSMTPHKI